MGNTCSSARNLPSEQTIKSFTYKGGSSQKVPKDANCISIKAGVPSIVARTFQFCPSITAVEIPPSVTVIDSDAFNGCSNLVEVHIPSSVTLIGHRAFHKCTSLVRVKIDSPPSSSLMSSSSPAVTAVTAVTSVTPATAVTAAATATPTTSILRRPSSATPNSNSNSNSNNTFQIGNEAFLECKQLKSITLPKSLTSIGKYAFYGCTNLSTVTIHPQSTLPSIEPSTFGNCTSLVRIYLPKNQSFKHICRSAFYKCSSLEYIRLPQSVTVIGPDSFYGCSSLVRLGIPFSVQHLDLGAFQYCSKLEFMDVHPSVGTLPHTTVGNPAHSPYAFQGCTHLISIAVPSDVTTIGMCSFQGCTNLLSVYLPPSVTFIGNGAFKNCVALTSIVLPEGVVRGGLGSTSIATDAFRNCRTLQKAFMESPRYNADGVVSTYNDFLDFLKYRFEDLPLHNDCYQYPNFMVGADGGRSYGKNMSSYQQLRLIVSSYTDPFGAFFIETLSKDGFEMTPLHVLACNPNADMGAMKVFMDALPAAHKIIVSTKMKSMQGVRFGSGNKERSEPQQQQQQHQELQSYSPLQLYLKTRGLTYIPLIKALKQGMPWLFIEEMLSMQTSVYDIHKVDGGKGSSGSGSRNEHYSGGADDTVSTKGLYPFMIAAVQKNCDLETTFRLALSSVDLIRK